MKNVSCLRVYQRSMVVNVDAEEENSCKKCATKILFVVVVVAVEHVSDVG